MPAHLANPTDDTLSPGGNPRITYAAILLKGTFRSNGPDANLGAFLFKKQRIAGANSQSASNLMGHGNLPLTRNLGLFRHVYSSIPYPSTDLLTFHARRS